MDLATVLLKEHSKRLTETIIAYVNQDESRLDELVALVTGGKPILAQRASWPLSYVAIRNPDWIEKHLPSLISLLKRTDLHQAVTRNIYRFLQEIDIPEELEGKVAESAIRHIHDPRTPIAIKAFAITVLGNLCKKYPELAQEVRLLLEDERLNESGAIKVRMRCVLKALDKLDKIKPGR
ncbi:MAG: hypothetical protein WC760_01160 [Bacteroidia bacterium]